MTTQAPIDMEVFEDAIQAWMSEATDLQTIWSDQSKPRPDYPYSSLNITSGPDAVSPFWEHREETDLTRTGREIKITVCVLCQFSISCQIYVSNTDAKNPKLNSRSLMTRALAALAFPTELEKLHIAGISVINKNSVSNINELIKDKYVSRSNMDVVFGAALNADDYVTYIQKVQLKSNSLGIDTIVEIPDP